MSDAISIANRGDRDRGSSARCAVAGLRSVAVYSEADADLLHVVQADEAVCIARRPQQKAISTVLPLSPRRKRPAQAIHPGYGFLAENAEFAEACEAAGITIGPRPEHTRHSAQAQRAALAEAQGVLLRRAMDW